MAKTLQEKLASAQALVAKYEAAIASENALNVTEVGDDVTFTFGRGAKKRSLSGTVRFISNGEGAKVAAVEVQGEDGFPETFKVRVADITENRTADQRAADEAEEASEESPLEAE